MKFYIELLIRIFRAELGRHIEKLKNELLKIDRQLFFYTYYVILLILRSNSEYAN